MCCTTTAQHIGKTENAVTSSLRTRCTKHWTNWWSVAHTTRWIRRGSSNDCGQSRLLRSTRGSVSFDNFASWPLRCVTTGSTVCHWDELEEQEGAHSAVSLTIDHLCWPQIVLGIVGAAWFGGLFYAAGNAMNFFKDPMKVRAPEVSRAMRGFVCSYSPRSFAAVLQQGVALGAEAQERTGRRAASRAWSVAAGDGRQARQGAVRAMFRRGHRTWMVCVCALRFACFGAGG